MPSVGTNKGMEAAYPFCDYGNKSSRPYGAVMMGIWPMATKVDMINATL